MTQQPDGVRSDADPQDVTPASPPPPDEFLRLVHFVLFAVAVYLLQPVCVSLALAVLQKSGFYGWYYGEEFVAAALRPDGPASTSAQTRAQLWAVAAAFPLWAACAAVLIVRLPRGFR